MISTHWRHPHEPAERELRFLDLLARQAADLVDRKQAEARLSENEGRLWAFLRASSDVIFRMSADWNEMRYLDGKEFMADTPDPSATWIDKDIFSEDQPHKV